MNATSYPNMDEERELWAQGYLRVAGIDEVGRGPLAGPVMAAAIVLPRDYNASWTKRVKDSKLLTPSLRIQLAFYLEAIALGVGIGEASHQEIDTLGILPATHLSMVRAIKNLRPRPDFLFVDAIHLTDAGAPCKAIVHGDATCFSIASASIVAKVTRDRFMVEVDQEYPGYGFAQHKGYPTPQHLEALQSLGPSPVHRRRFAPVRRLL